ENPSLIARHFLLRAPPGSHSAPLRVQVPRHESTRGNSSSCSLLYCRRRDLNPHGFPHWLLRPACLPISPRRHICVFQPLQVGSIKSKRIPQHQSSYLPVSSALSADGLTANR